MAVIVTVQITDDDTGEVKQSFVERYDIPSWHSFESSRAIRALLHRVFVTVYGADDEWA